MRIKINQETLKNQALFPIFDIILRFVEIGRHSFEVDSIDDIAASDWGHHLGKTAVELIKHGALSTSYTITDKNPLVVVDEAAPAAGETDFENRLTRVAPLEAIYLLTLPFSVIVENEVYDGGFLLWMAKAVNNQSFLSAYRNQRFQFRHAGGKTGLSVSSQVFSDGVWPRSDGAYSRALRLWNGVMLDSDAEFPGHTPNDGIVTACAETTAWVHELQARSTENYIPKEAMLKFVPNGADKTRVHNYFDLSEMQRKHYNLKKGFKTDASKADFQADDGIPAALRALYDDVPEVSWDCLSSGFGSGLSRIFVEEQFRPNTGLAAFNQPQRKTKLRNYSKRC